MRVDEVASERSRTILAVRGDIDRTAVDELRTLLFAATSRTDGQLDLDLSGVTSFPRAGLGLLVSAKTWSGDRLRVICNTEVRQVLEDAGLARVLPLA
jgi:anti-anti-sigma factor